MSVVTPFRKTPLPEKESAAGVRYQRRTGGNNASWLVKIRQISSSLSRPNALVALDLTLVNLLLKVAVVLLSVYFAVSFMASVVMLSRQVETEVKVEQAQEVKPSQIVSLLKATSYYLEKARQRDIFNMGIRPIPVGGGFISRGPSPRIIEATQSLRLVGISWSNDPDVMIEDIKNQRTFFLKQGQVMENDVRLERVYKDKVVLSFAGEEIELR